jgi:hypothetical protein
MEGECEEQHEGATLTSKMEWKERARSSMRTGGSCAGTNTHLKDGMEGQGEEQHEGAEGAVLEHTVGDVAVILVPIILVVDLSIVKQSLSLPQRIFKKKVCILSMIRKMTMG